ncbi:MAG: polysaccharide biosynthesis/export family protein [Verrucomicrobia bacterium]|nr:polysaccharide biosynthesis/export family protein [Verrucomicrobiota bacterium]
MKFNRITRLVFTLAALGALRVLHAAELASTPVNAGSFTNLSSYVSMDSLDNTQKLGIGDKISFRIIEDREEPKSLTVADSGELEIPYFRRISATNKTCKQLADELKALLEKDLYYHATVIIAIDTLNKSRGRIYLSGMVRQAGAQDIPSDIQEFTISKAISHAGGFLEFAAKDRIKITRRSKNGGKPTTTVVNVAEILEKGMLEKDLKLEPEDYIWVPAKLLNY